MSVRIQRIRGELRFVFFDTNGEGLPIVDRPGAWRRSVYRVPA